jgi:hypothetical protein
VVADDHEEHAPPYQRVFARGNDVFSRPAAGDTLPPGDDGSSV